MSGKIQTKPFQYGDEKEGTWPSKWPTGETGSFYIDQETGKCVKGYPPPRNANFGQAPYVISDSMNAYRHPMTGRVLDSKSALRHEDNASGTITTDAILPGDRSHRRQLERARKEDGHQALHKAVAQIDAGTAPLSEETRALCAQENERVSNLLGFDAFNVVGKKDDERGFKYRR